MAVAGSWTLGRRLALAFVVPLAVLAILSGVTYWGTDVLIDTRARAAAKQEVLQAIVTLDRDLLEMVTEQRGYVILGDPKFITRYQAAREEVQSDLERLRALNHDNPAQQQRLAELQPILEQRIHIAERSIAERQAGRGAEAQQALLTEGEQNTLAMRRLLDEMATDARQRLRERDAIADRTARTVKAAIALGTVLAVLLVAAAAWLTTRSLTRPIGGAVQHLQTSASELESSAAEQAATAKEQATAAGEVSATMKELLASSRQIAERVGAVAEAAERTGQAAGGGGAALAKAQEGQQAIKRQVDAIVAHMLELGRKSQQIGAVLDLVGELSEQTNILAINATIEAAGAGEAGRRFAAVAEEIRKLADRVGGSTKEVRALVDEIRSASSTTVMATEQGARAAETGTRQFEELAHRFREIADMVRQTLDTAREIELSTRQQITAVEQVNAALLDVARSARQVEQGSQQTVEVAGQLAALSRSLADMVHGEKAGRT